jgi:hypothetical protein
VAVPVAQIVDAGALVSVVVASLAAGTGLTAGFSIAIFTATRATELRRAGAAVGATVLGLIAVVAGLACLALVAFGIFLIAS